MISLNDEYKKILKNLRFIDLFSGIGGFRLALESYGAECVFSSDNNKFACETYKENFGDNSYFDITKIDEREIPNHEILCAGFPCQAFSISGKQKGFEDTRGTLFFDLVRIIKHKKPKILFLENVNNLLKHNKGKTFKIMKNILSDLNYDIFFKVLNSSEFGLAQSRKRLYIMGFEKNSFRNINFNFPNPLNDSVLLKDILVESDDLDKYHINRTDIKLNSKTLNNTLFIANKKPIRIGLIGKGGQGERIYSVLGKAITLSAEGGGPGSKTGAYLVKDKIRKLTPRECARLQGFPEYFKIHSSDSQASKQFGNSVSINVLQSILKEIIDNHIEIINILKEKNKMTESKNLKLKGSETAKNGFKNEYLVIDKFNNWKEDKDSQNWLNIMGYNIENIEKVEAEKIKGSFKSDVQAKVKIYLKNLIDAQNISVKLVSNDVGYNQIDKRYVDKYIDLWNIPLNIVNTLKKFTGEYQEKYSEKKLKDPRRMFLDEIDSNEVKELVIFFKKNKIIVISDLLKGRGKFSAEWMLVVKRLNLNNDIDWVLKSMNEVMNYFGNGEVVVTKKGNLKIGKIVMQRKGGDNGRETSKMLQFKINPLNLFDITD